MMHEDEEYEPTPAQVEFQKRLEYTEDGLDAIDSHKPMASVIWVANHRDEGGLSVAGADNIAKALIMAGYGKVSQEPPQEPRPVPEDDRGVLERLSDDIYNFFSSIFAGFGLTTPDLQDGAMGPKTRAVGEEIISRVGRTDAWYIPPRMVDVGPRGEDGARDPNEDSSVWDITPGRIVVSPDPEPMIDYDRLQRTIVEAIAEADAWRNRNS